MQGAVNQTRQWLWARRKFSDSPINSLRTAPSSSSFSFDSYKELNCSKFSFAADDPWSFLLLKSYDCSFCGREFQSAQALGGHMNVHRVDRAKMRLASESNLKPSTCLECKTNPNSSPSYSQSSEENCSKTFLVESGSMDLKLGRERWKAEEMDYSKRKEFCVGYDIVTNKKQKKTADLMLALSFTSYEGEMEICKPDQVEKLVSIEAEELDLELRLGDPPKLKQISCNVVVIE